MVVLTSRRSRIYHLPGRHWWGMSLCGVRVSIEEELDNVANEVIDARECRRCANVQASGMRFGGVPHG